MPFQSGAAWSTNGGNPRGRPRKGHAVADYVRAELARDYAVGQTYGQRLAQVLVGMAVDGNLEAAKWVVERVDGKVPDVKETSKDVRVLVRYIASAPAPPPDELPRLPPPPSANGR